MPIMSHAEWMRDTNPGVFTPRSDELVMLDAAIRTYGEHPGQLEYFDAISTAFVNWSDKKGTVESPVRNTKGAVTKLMRQLVEFRNTHSQARHLQAPALMGDIRQGAALLRQGKLRPQISVTIPVGVRDTTRGNVVFEGFDDRQIVRARQAWYDAYDCARMAVEGIGKIADMGLTRMFDGEGPESSDVEDARFKRWFGNPTQAAIDKVQADLEKMWEAFQHTPVVIVNREDIATHSVDGKDPFGDMHPGPRGRDIGGFVRIHQAGSGYRVVMCAGFLYDPDPQQTMYHELTHKVLHTRDHCYTKGKSRKLARTAQEMAMTNADNFGYYALSFMKDI